MAESTLALTKNELEGEIGFFLGYGRGSANSEAAWTTAQTNVINSCRRAGLASFYVASAAGPEAGYQWSFLRPLVTLTLAQSANTVRLPDDYQGVEGRITVSSPSSQVYRPVPVVGVPLIQQNYSRTPNMVGWPQLAAIQPLKYAEPVTGQRFQLFVFPLADQQYSLQFTYYLNVDDLDVNRPYPYGGAQHRDAIISACCAAAEQKIDDMAGPQSQRYQEHLLASIAIDRRNKPQLTGYNADRSDHDRGFGDLRTDIYTNDQILVNGIQY